VKLGAQPGKLNWAGSLRARLSFCLPIFQRKRRRHDRRCYRNRSRRQRSRRGPINVLAHCIVPRTSDRNINCWRSPTHSRARRPTSHGQRGGYASYSMARRLVRTLAAERASERIAADIPRSLLRPDDGSARRTGQMLNIAGPPSRRATEDTRQKLRRLRASACMQSHSCQKRSGIAATLSRCSSVARRTRWPPIEHCPVAARRSPIIGSAERPSDIGAMRSEASFACEVRKADEAIEGKLAVTPL